MGTPSQFASRHVTMTTVVREWNLLIQGWQTAGPLGVLCSSITGAILGMVVAFMVICSLVEVSISFFEAVLFGFVLLFVGAFMIWRAVATGEAQPPVFFRIIMGGFGAIVGVSGLCCFMLQEGWRDGMSPHAKVPIYFLLGTTLSFSVIFGFGEIVNICAGSCMQDVEGIIFGTLDAEDDVYLRDNFQKTNGDCIPIGASVGFFMGLINESLRHQPSSDGDPQKNRTDPY